MLQKIGDKIGMFVGAAIGHSIAPGGPGEIIGAGAGAGASKVTSGIGNAMQAKRIANQMPMVGDAIKDWQKAATTAQISNSDAVKALLTNASEKLARNLNRLGVSITAAELQKIPQNNAPPMISIPVPMRKRGGAVVRRDNPDRYGRTLKVMRGIK